MLHATQVKIYEFSKSQEPKVYDDPNCMLKQTTFVNAETEIVKISILMLSLGSSLVPWLPGYTLSFKTHLRKSSTEFKSGECGMVWPVRKLEICRQRGVAAVILDKEVVPHLAGRQLCSFQGFSFTGWLEQTSFAAF